MATYIFTPEEYELLNAEIEEVRDRLRQIMLEKGEAGRGQDTWHDEGYKVSSVQEMTWSKRLSDLQRLFFNAKVITPEEQNEYVKIGTGVVIEYEDGTEYTFILGGYQIGKLKNRVSVYSPMGKALIGAKAGEDRSFQVGEKKRRIKVKKIISPSKAKAICDEDE